MSSAPSKPRPTIIFTGTRAIGGLAYFTKATALELEKHVDVKLYYIHRDGSLMAKTWIFMVSLIRLLAYQYLSALTKGKRAIIHVNTANRGSFIRSSIIVLLTSPLKKSTLFHVHVTELVGFLDRIWNSGWIGRWYLRSVFDRMDHFIFISNAVAEPFISLLQKFGMDIRNKSRVIYDGVETKRINLSNGKYKLPRLKILIAAGRLVEEKNPQLSIALASKLKLAMDNFHISVTGKGPMLDSLKRQVEKERLSHLITFHGWLDEEDYHSLLGESHILIVPSQREGMGYCILDGYAGGLAVIANRTGGIPEILEHGENGFLVTNNHIDEYSECVHMLNQDRMLLKKIGLHNLEVVEKHHIENRVKEILEVYHF